MSAPAHRTHDTLAEYLAFEASSNVKHEYLDGQIYVSPIRAYSRIRTSPSSADRVSSTAKIEWPS